MEDELLSLPQHKGVEPSGKLEWFRAQKGAAQKSGFLENEATKKAKDELIKCYWTGGKNVSSSAPLNSEMQSDVNRWYGGYNRQSASSVLGKNGEVVHTDGADKIVHQFAQRMGTSLDSNYFFQNVGTHLSYDEKTGILTHKTFHKDGKTLHYIRSYNAKGQLSGSMAQYKEDGSPVIEYNYKDGKKNGLQTDYFPQETREETYKNGILDGAFRVKDKTGQMVMEGFFINGKEDGQFTEYDKNGKVITSETFKNGELVKETTLKESLQQLQTPAKENPKKGLSSAVLGIKSTQR